MARPFLRRFEDELTAWAEDNRHADMEALTACFGAPEEAAAEFLSQLDPWEINRFAYARLKRTYAALGVMVAGVLLCVGLQVKGTGADQATHVRYAQRCAHPGGEECETFWVKTSFRGKDCYWEYHSAEQELYKIPPPESADGTEPYAEELYLNGADGMTHWQFTDLHCFWCKVRDEET